MRLAWISVAFALVWMCVPAWPQAKKAAARKTTAAAASSKKTSPASKASSKKPRVKSTTARRRTRGSGRVYRASQQAPSRERYAEIQKALIAKGYYQGEPDGNWGDSSTAALKKFQEDQTLKPDGKLSSLSLIALGLGPKHTAAVYPPKSSAEPVTVPSSPPAPTEPASDPPVTSPRSSDPVAQPLQ